MQTYRLLNDSKLMGRNEGSIPITKEGALIVWSAYEKMFGKGGQTMEQRESRGGVAWVSELDYFKRSGALDKDFDYKKYLVIPEPV